MWDTLVLLGMMNDTLKIIAVAVEESIYLAQLATKLSKSKELVFFYLFPLLNALYRSISPIDNLLKLVILFFLLVIFLVEVN